MPELVPIRYGRMLVSPFTFYRGAALIMAADLAGTPRSGITTQVCGDAHLMNFGAFASPERRLVFGINDFDETCPARGSGTSSGSRPASPSPGATAGSRPRSARRVLLALLGEYRRAMRAVRGMSNLDVWYAHIDVDGAIKELRAGVERGGAQAGRGQRGQGAHPRQPAAPSTS